MRTPPRKKIKVNHRYLAAVLIACVIAVIGFATFGYSVKSSTNSAAALVSAQTVAPSGSLVSVVVAAKGLQTGEAFEQGTLSTVSERADKVPDDAVKSLHELEGRVAFAPISAHSPITRANVGNSVAVIPSSIGAGDGSVVESLLSALGARMRRTEVTLSADAPQRGSRIALVYTAQSGKQSLVLQQGWVFAADGRKITLLVAPEDESVLRTFQPTAIFSAVLLRATDAARELIHATPVESAAEAG